MKVAIITHSSTFNERAEAVACYFEDNGHTAVRVFADFDHHKKKTLNSEERISDQKHLYVHLKPYASNLSLTRLLNIRKFALDTGEVLRNGGYDLLYFLIPANTFARVGAMLKQQTGARLVFDVIDLWPESLPLKKLLWLPPVRYWAKQRDQYIGEADVIFTECAMYQKRLKLPMEKTHTLYWCKDTTMMSMEPNSSGCKKGTESTAADVLRVAYIGAINNIIDIPRIAKALELLCAAGPVHLDMIGDGEHRQEFVEAAKAAGVEVTYHGRIYEEAEKQRILSRCQVGLNIMKPGVQAGLSMKSIDYLSYGIPLINNLKGDLWELSESCGIGVNVPDDLMEMKNSCENEFTAQVRAISQNSEARRQAKKVFESYFTADAFRAALAEGLRQMDGI